jgi:galactonate dehydratase
MRMKNTSEDSVSRRTVTGGGFATLGLAASEPAEAAVRQRAGKEAPIPSKDNLKITKLETILVKPRWLFLKVHTNAGMVGLGEPITEGRALTCATGVKEVEP